ncbi:hypothetical protein AAE02nite_37180 [Adhaeribacter aerolatus]|uniref:Uncharacterized protein n=1 Tax=Adhaeribacter aerolatus TaxID=670289 RepID=A0A512B262_9BACT|nr:hypothetical protein AAE02nite_37180 [Adhaeribacter aerolatus]
MFPWDNTAQKFSRSVSGILNPKDKHVPEISHARCFVYRFRKESGIFSGVITAKFNASAILLAGIFTARTAVSVHF